MAVTVAALDVETRALADSLAGVVAAPLVTRGQCTDAYTTLRRSQKITLAASMQWDLLTPFEPRQRTGIGGGTDPTGLRGRRRLLRLRCQRRHLGLRSLRRHGPRPGSAQLAHLAVSSYRHSRRSGLDLEAAYQAMDQALADPVLGERFVTKVPWALPSSVRVKSASPTCSTRWRRELPPSSSRRPGDSRPTSSEPRPSVTRLGSLPGWRTSTTNSRR